jgi:hypothetical protein
MSTSPEAKQAAEPTQEQYAAAGRLTNPGISPEAKQAAEAWASYYPEELAPSDKDKEHYGFGYDAATVKLREMLLELAEASRKSEAKLRERITELEEKAKLRESDRTFLWAVNVDLGCAWGKTREAIANLREELDVARSELARRATENDKL